MGTTRLRLRIGRAGSGGFWVALLAALLAVSPARSEISGTAAAAGWYRGAPVLSPPVSGRLTVEAAAARLELAVRPASTGFLDPGEQVLFEAQLTNSGNVTLSGIAVEAPGAEGCGKPPGALAPGETFSCHLARVVELHDLAAGEAPIEVSAGARDPAGVQVLAAPTRTAVPATRADLVTQISLPPGTVLRERAPFTLQLSLRNGGPEPATGIELAVKMPEELVYRGHGGDGLFEAATGRWQVARLAAGEEAMLVIEAVPGHGAAGRELVVEAQAVRADRHDGRSEGDRNRLVVRVPAAHVEAQLRFDPPGAVRVGDAITLLASLRNRGPDAAEALSLDLPVPAGMTLSGSEASRGSYAHGQWRIGGLAAGEEAALRLYGVAAMAAAGGAVTLAEVPQLTAGTDDPAADEMVLPRPVLVLLPVLEAVDDEAEGLDGVAGATGFANVLDNDRIDGRPATAEDVVTIADGSGPLRLSADGWLSLAAGASEGRHELGYRMCLRLLPHRCADGRVSVLVEVPAAISGIVFRDDNGSGAHEPGSDRPMAGHSVSLLSEGRRVARAVTDPAGGFRFPKLPAAEDFRILVHDSRGSFAGGLSGLRLQPGGTLESLELPVDPAGIVYDAVSRRPLAGATVRIADAAGNVLPPACLLDPDIRETDEDGGYRIALAPGGDPACPAAATAYRLLVTPPPGYDAAPSVLLPPLPGAPDFSSCAFDAAPGGLCTASARAEPPAVGSPATYFLAFTAARGDRMALHNHIPLDPAVGGTLAEIVASAEDAGGGKFVITIEARNRGRVPLAGVIIDVVLPAGFAYLPGTARLGDVLVTPAASAALLRLGGIDIGSGGRAALRLTVTPIAALTAGDYAARARLFDSDGNPVSAEARAVVSVTASEPAPACAGVEGRIFIDSNRNGLDDAGEPGVAGVRVAAGGAETRSDRIGAFLLHCRDMKGVAAGSTLAVTADLGTVPAGYRLRGEAEQYVLISAADMARVSFATEAGRIVRLEISGSAFEEGSATLKQRWREGIRDLIETLSAEFSVLHIRYGRRDALAETRLRAVAELVQRQWRENGQAWPLAIHTEIAE